MKPAYSFFGLKRIVRGSVCLGFLAFSSPSAHHLHVKPLAPDSTVVNDTDSDERGAPAMGLDEKCGNIVPDDLSFVNEAGKSVRFGDVLNGPTVLTFLYYRCPNACNMLLSGIAATLRAMTGGPGSPPNVVVVSISDNETAADAEKARHLTAEIIGTPYPADKLHFLTGNADNIKKITDAVGFHFVKIGEEYDHTLGLVILSPGGKVVRYINGTEYLPIDISMSLMQASQGIVQPTIARVLRACFTYDPKSHRLVFGILRVSATVIFLFIGIFITWLIVSSRSRHSKGRP